ncbi:MAG: hypothetical protein Q4B43_00695 [Bacteroidota bacterium]|nr:hypothetical protein [Bacteroidota bacterium]
MKNVLKISVATLGVALLSFGFSKKNTLSEELSSKFSDIEGVEFVEENNVIVLGSGSWSDTRHVSSSVAKDMAKETVTKKVRETNCQCKQGDGPDKPTVDQSEVISSLIDKYDV